MNKRLDIGLVLLGFFVALFSAGVGIGGGTILVSALVSLFGFNFKKAASTSLATIIPITFVGAGSHLIFGSASPPLRYYLVFIPACVFGSILGGKLFQKRQNRPLKMAFALFLLVVSLRMLQVFDVPSAVYSGLHGLLFSNGWLLIVPVGFLIGIIAVLLGIGCGLIIVPFYVIIIGLNMHEAITLSLTTMFCMSLTATLVHKKLHSLDVGALRSLFVPALAGAVVGSVISGYLPGVILKTLFGSFLFIMAWRYLIYEGLPQQLLIRLNLAKVQIGKAES